MQLLTNSRSRCFQRCRREHLHSYIQGRRPRKKGEALGFGTLFHNALEQWWLTWMDIQAGKLQNDPLAMRALQGVALDSAPLECALSAIRLTFQGVADESDLTIFDLVKAEELMRGYHYRWRDEMEHLDVLAVEVKFECALVNPGTGHPSRTFRLGGKLDVIVRDRRDNEVRNVEHKTTSADLSAQSDYWLRLRIDGQLSTYHVGGRELGYDVFGSLYDVIRKPTQQPRKETPDDKKKWTKGKVCKLCKARGLTPVTDDRGLPMGMLIDKNGPSVEIDANDCAACTGNGYEVKPWLNKNLRAADETPKEYSDRIREAIVEDPNKHYGRAEVIRLDDDIKEHQADMWFTAKAMLMAENLEAHPRNPDACVRYGRFCSYFDVCTGVASIDDEDRFRQSSTMHEELAEVFAPKEAASGA